MSTEAGGPRPGVGRRAVSVAAEGLARRSYLEGREGFPLVVEPGVAGLRAAEWAGAERARLVAEVEAHGAVLLRGFAVGGAEGFEALARAVTPDLLDYRERAAPRFEVGRNIYTSTEFPADQHIPLHHEMSYSHNWPMKLWFYCEQPAARGGATPIASDREVFKRLDPQIKETFLRKGVMYVRNYGDGLDLTWQDAFQTTDKSVVESYCRRSHMEFEWREGGRLRTRQSRQVVVTHPKTGETVWFNHAHMFHVSNLGADVRESLLKEFGEEYLPRNAYYGDGTPIESSVLEEIRETYRHTAVTFPWQKGDLLLLDNVLASHGREPFEGPRKILVAMAELYSL
jgi:alpha-ketoglutarate-dependent taurine dioxygenase